MKLTIEEMKPVFQEFLRQIAADYDLAELLHHEIELVHNNSLSVSAFVGVRGQLSGIVSRLKVKVLFIYSEINNLNQAVLDYEYYHHDGGGNGKTVYFWVQHESSFGIPGYVRHANMHCVDMINRELNDHYNNKK